MGGMFRALSPLGSRTSLCSKKWAPPPRVDGLSLQLERAGGRRRIGGKHRVAGGKPRPWAPR